MEDGFSKVMKIFCATSAMEFEEDLVKPHPNWERLAQLHQELIDFGGLVEKLEAEDHEAEDLR